MEINKPKVIGICGVYGEGEEFSGGQPVKVKTMIDMFVEKNGDAYVKTANTYNWKRHPYSLLKRIIMLAKECNYIFIMPAHNGLKVFAPLFYCLKKIYGFKLIYSVIGGWLPEYTAKYSWLSRTLKNFDYIFVETTTMKNSLNKQNFNNVFVVNNAKTLRINTEFLHPQNTLSLCYFSRVMREKGIEDAISAVIKVNCRNEERICKLDIYGPIAPEYASDFEKQKCGFPEYIEYKYVVKPSDSVDVLRNYAFQLFPTRFHTEGIPGSIIDSYAAGTPVIAAKWDSFVDVVIEGETGYGFEQNNVEDMVRLIEFAYSHKESLKCLQGNCIKRYKEYYTVDSVYNRIGDIIGWQ